MKIIVKKVVGKQYCVEISQGNQFFYLDLGHTRVATKEECEYFAKMFRKALKAHNFNLTN